MKIKEIRHGAEPKAVYHIADRAADDKPNANQRQPVGGLLQPQYQQARNQKRQPAE